MTDQSGGNRFIRGFDPGALSVTTKRIADGRISVGVYGALVELDWSTKGRRERAEPITDSEGAW